MSLNQVITNTAPVPVFDKPERIMPISGAIPIPIPFTPTGSVDVADLHDVEVWLVVNGERKLQYRKVPPTELSQHNALLYNASSPHMLYCTVTGQQTEKWRGLVQAHIKFIGTDAITRDIAETEYLVITLFIAHKGYEALSQLPIQMI